MGFDIEGGKVRIHGDGKAGISYIAEDDVARGVVACVDNPATVRADIDYGGPVAVSQLEAVALAEQVTGRKIAVEHMSLDQLQAARKAPNDSPTASFLALFETTAKGHAVPTARTQTLGFQPISMREWLGQNYRQRIARGSRVSA